MLYNIIRPYYHTMPRVHTTADHTTRPNDKLPPWPMNTIQAVMPNATKLLIQPAIQLYSTSMPAGIHSLYSASWDIAKGCGAGELWGHGPGGALGRENLGTGWSCAGGYSW